MIYPRELNSWQKTIALAVWCGAGAIFMTVGWCVVSPKDPLAAVSLLTSHHVVHTWLQMLVLVAVASAIATIVLGRLLPDAGVFAAAVGLAALALRGGTAEYLLLRQADLRSSAHDAPVIQLIGEALAWTLVLVMAVVTSGVISRWYFGTEMPSHESVRGAGEGKEDLHRTRKDDLCRTRLLSLSGSQLPLIGRWLTGGAGGDDAARCYRDGLKHTAFVAATMLVLMSVFSVDSAHRPIQHGQVCFVVAAAAWIATYYGLRYFPVPTALWSLAAVPLVCVLGYLWSGMIPVDPSLPPNLPASAMLRPLPIQYIALGYAGALAAFWFAHHPASAAPQPKRSKRRKPSRASVA